MKNYLIDKFNSNNWNSTDYSNFLYEKNTIKSISNTEFVIKSSKLLEKFKNNEFWLKPPKEAFKYLLDEIKSNKFRLEDISFVLPNDIIMAGFEEYILEYVNSRDYIAIREARIRKKLSKEKEMDLILLESIRKFLEKQTAIGKQEEQEETLTK